MGSALCGERRTPAAGVGRPPPAVQAPAGWSPPCMGGRAGETPPAPPSAPIRFTFRVCPGLFVRRLEIITSWFFQKQIGPRHNAEPLLWLSTCISGGNTERVQKSAPARTRSFGSLLRGSALPPQLRSASALGRLVPRCTGVVLLWTCSLTLGRYVVGKSGAQVFFFFFFKHIENKRDPPT